MGRNTSSTLPAPARGDRPAGAGGVGLAEQAGRVRDLEQQRRGRLVQAGRPGQPPQVAYAEAAGPQHRRPARRPAPPAAPRRAGPPPSPARRRPSRPTSARGPARSSGGGAGAQRAERPGVAAQQQPDLAGQLDQLAVSAGAARPAGLVDSQAPATGACRVGRSTSSARPVGDRPRRPERADRRPGGQPVQHRPGAPAARPARSGAARPRRRRARAAAGPGRRPAGPDRPGTASRPRRRRPPPAARSSAPYSRNRARSRSTAARTVAGRAVRPPAASARTASTEVGAVCRVPAQPGRVEDLQGELVQPVEAAGHRAPGLGADGERGDVGRHRHDEVGAQLEQRAQGLVGERPEVVGECGGHRRTTLARPGARPSDVRLGPGYVLRMPPLTVGFDLDMTLIDSRPGIAAAYRALTARTGVYVDADLAVTRLGPPLRTELAHWFPPEQVEEAVTTYRALYPEYAITPTVPMPGAEAALAAVHGRGGRVVVVTSKLGRLAQLHLDHLGLAVDELAGDLFAEGKATALREHGVGLVRRRPRRGHGRRPYGGGPGHRRGDRALFAGRATGRRGAHVLADLTGFPAALDRIIRLALRG